MEPDHDLNLVDAALAEWQRLHPGRDVSTMTRDEYLAAHMVVAQEEAEAMQAAEA